MSDHPNANVPMPDDYVAMLRHYMPDLPMATISEAWLHNATALEVMRHCERLGEGK